jgi:hypothetical protein
MSNPKPLSEIIRRGTGLGRGERDHPVAKEVWLEHTKAAFKAEMKMRGHTYKTLSRALSEIGISEPAESIANRVSRGTFSAAKLLQYLTAMGTKHFQVYF